MDTLPSRALWGPGLSPTFPALEGTSWCLDVVWSGQFCKKKGQPLQMCEGTISSAAGAQVLPGWFWSLPQGALFSEASASQRISSPERRFHQLLPEKTSVLILTQMNLTLTLMTFQQQLKSCLLVVIVH